MGDCQGMAAATCLRDSECSKGFRCTATAGTCQTIIPVGMRTVGAACFDDADCNSGENCVGETAGVCTCDDGETCTQNDVCEGSTCTGTAFTGTCTDGNPCTTDVCNNGSCSSTNVTNGTTCDDGIACTSNTTCTAGDCGGGTANNSACESTNACQTCTCNIDKGCECDLIDGQSTEACSINLQSLAGLTQGLKDALTALTVNACNVGATDCNKGVEGSCVPSQLFASTCEAATLNTACSTTVFTLEANAATATQLCDELKGLANP